MSSVPSANVGGTVLIPIQCRNTSDVPTAPDSDPSYTVYDSTGAQVGSQTGTFSLNPGSNTGFYQLVLTVSTGNGYAANSKYSVLVTWAISSSNRAQEFAFHVQ